MRSSFSGDERCQMVYVTFKNPEGAETAALLSVFISFSIPPNLFNLLLHIWKVLL